MVRGQTLALVMLGFAMSACAGADRFTLGALAGADFPTAIQLDSFGEPCVPT